MPLSTINSNSIGNGTVVASDILDGTISTSKLVASNIAGDRIAANTLSNTVFQTGSVENYLRGANLDFGMRNRIINGAMVIDQRNAGAAVTPANSDYTLDRWKSELSQSAKFTIQQDSSANTVAGFASSLKVTSLSSYSVGASDYFDVFQWVEGFNWSDMMYGTANAKTATLSFWVRSSLTGTFGGSITNSAQNYSYPFTYTISSANTWEYKTVTFTGPTAGTWLATTNRGVGVFFSLGMGSNFSGTANSWSGNQYYSATGATSVVGTNGATFYITGVQVEEGSVPTAFEYRQYGTELALCQRYYEKSYNVGTVPGTATTDTGSSNLVPGTVGGSEYTSVPLKVPKRATSTITIYNDNTGASGTIRVFNGGGFVGSISTTVDLIGENGFRVAVSRTSDTLFIIQWVASAEL